MNNRIVTIVGLATLISLSAGCSGQRNVFFGRGARCGLCTPRPGSMIPPPLTAPAPYCQAPACQAPNCQQVPPVYQAPPCQSLAHGGDCGCYGSAYGNCESCGSVPVHGQGCGCGNEVYGQDPYLPGGAVDPYGSPIVGNPVYSDEIYGGQVIDGAVQGGQILPSDNFQQRSNRVDADGNKILWEEPLPSDATSL